MSAFNESKVNRQSAGTSAGGQFANKERPANDGVSLGGSGAGSQRIAPGITFVSTSDEAGYQLSPSKDLQVPIHLRQPRGRYLGDHSVTPLYFFPEEFVGTFPGADDAESVREYASNILGPRLSAQSGAQDDFIAKVTDFRGFTPKERQRAEAELLVTRDAGWGGENLADMWQAGRVVGSERLNLGAQDEHAVWVLTRFGPPARIALSKPGYDSMVGLPDLGDESQGQLA